MATDEDTGQTYHRRGDGSGVVERTPVPELSVSERREAQLSGEVEVARGNQTLTLSCDDPEAEPVLDVVYYD